MDVKGNILTSPPTSLLIFDRQLSPGSRGAFATHAPVNLCMLRVTAGMRLRRAYVFVSRQFSNRCGSSGARNTMARLFVFIVILVIFSQCYLAGSAKKIEKWLRGMREKVPAALLSKGEKL